MIVVGFGIPGCGKTSLLSNFVQLNKRKKDLYFKRNSPNPFFRYLTEPLYSASEFYCWYREKIGGKWVTYAVDRDASYARKDVNRFWRFCFNLFFPKYFYDVIYCTDHTISDTVRIDYDTLGTWKPTWNSCLVMDEAGIGLNCRNYKNLSSDAKELFACHRHKGADLLMVSQTVDVDKAARQRSELMFTAHKVGPFTFTRLIKFKLGVNRETHQLEDQYFQQHFFLTLIEVLFSWLPSVRKARLPFLKSKLIYRPSWYRYFNSYVDDHVYTNPDPAESPCSPV